MKLGCTISLNVAVIPGHQLTGPSAEEEEEGVLFSSPHTDVQAIFSIGF
jgi:hypothetical protein